MQETREKLRLLLIQKGVDYATLSRAIGKNQTYIQQYITKGTPRKLDGDDRRAICRYLGEMEDCLDDAPATPQKHHEINPKQINVMALPSDSLAPVYGYVAGSSDRVAINDGRIVGMRQRGPALAYSKDGFYVTVIGDSMEPRLRPGEFVAVNPALPPMKGDECVVQFQNGEAIVKTFVSQDEKNLTVKQYNPPKTMKFPVSEVSAVYPVVAIEKGR